MTIPNPNFNSFGLYPNLNSFDPHSPYQYPPNYMFGPNFDIHYQIPVGGNKLPLKEYDADFQHLMSITAYANFCDIETIDDLLKSVGIMFDLTEQYRQRHMEDIIQYRSNNPSKYYHSMRELNKTIKKYNKEIFAGYEIRLYELISDTLNPDSSTEYKEFVLRRQKEGIEVSKAIDKHLGKPKAETPENFDKIYNSWKSGDITAKDAMKELGLESATFYKMVNEKENNNNAK